MSDTNCTPSNVALAAAVTGLERELSANGWDQQPQLFVLIRTKTLLDTTPDLPPELRSSMETIVEQIPDHLTPVLQDDLPDAPLADLIGHLVFPAEVDGAAASVERIVLPPEAEDNAPSSEPERTEFFMEHPGRDDVRMVVGVTRAGNSWCALRVRSQDEDELVATGADLVPELIEALKGTLDEVDDSELLDPNAAFAREFE